MGKGEEQHQELDPQTEAELRRLAYRDHLTGLPNRIAMAARIEATVVRSQREGGVAALLLIDLDAFKRVNDTLGHARGDELLGLVARRLRELPEPRLDVGRHGGDEFLLLVDELPPEPSEAARAVQAIGARVLAALRDPFTVARCAFEVGASLGASIFPVDAVSGHELLDHADQAMYVAKRRGRGQMALFDKPEHHSVLQLESSLRVRRALADGELELFYQPVVELGGSGSLVSLEALLRWRDPDRGVLLPEAFLPFIEHSALVDDIAEWVFREVCRQLAEWRIRGFCPSVSFNVPARALERRDFAQFVTQTATAYGTDLTKVAAEITETNLVSVEEVMPTLRALRDAGMVLALDDFGIGYSSLARLRSMPFTVLKTDRSFMHGVPGDPVAEELVDGIITLGKRLGMRVIVEGVETSEQERTLTTLGCRLAQGYHLGSPVPAAEIETRWAGCQVLL